MKKHIGTFLYAVLAGICIGLGGTVFLRIKDAFPGGTVVGALLFAIGLFAICTRGYNLFTGKACYIFDNKPSYLGSLAVIWVGNLAGTSLLAAIERLTAICGTEAGINITAKAMVESKMSTSLGSVFLLACICNVFIYLAVNGYAKNPHEVGKYLAIFLGVSVFILAGTEHSIADMYYWAISGKLLEVPGQSFLYLLVISLGNVVGGVSFPLIEKLYQKLVPDTAA